MQSWQNSLRATAMVFQEAGLDDHGVLLEYQLPLSSRRLDCIVTGHDAERSANAVIIELKQWSDVDGASVVGDKVVTWVGGGHRRDPVGAVRPVLKDNPLFSADDVPTALAEHGSTAASDQSTVIRMVPGRRNTWTAGRPRVRDG